MKKHAARKARRTDAEAMSPRDRDDVAELNLQHEQGNSALNVEVEKIADPFERLAALRRFGARIKQGRLH
jgi:hypothetical protein